METLNLALAVYFFWLLRAKERSRVGAWEQQQKHKKGSHLRNRLVRSILVAEIAISTLPTYIAFALNLVSWTCA